MPTLELVRNAAAAAPVASRDAVAEANHRIANNLTLVASLVRMHARTIAARSRPLGNDEVRFLLEEIGGRIETIGRLHRLLTDAERGTALRLRDYLRDVSEAVVASLVFAGKARLTHTSTLEGPVAADQALPLGLIVGELVTNAVKYAHPAGVTGHIMVGCHRAEGGTVVEVADDGVGFPEDFEPRTDGGMGMRLVRSLADQLRARLAFRDTGIGVSVTLHLPA